jgi:hypothetical protein
MVVNLCQALGKVMRPLTTCSPSIGMSQRVDDIIPRRVIRLASTARSSFEEFPWSCSRFQSSVGLTNPSDTQPVCCSRIVITLCVQESAETKE